MSENKRASFGGKLSVILVAAGSAIGLGALWRFPYIAGKHGGAAFLPGSRGQRHQRGGGPAGQPPGKRAGPVSFGGGL